MSELKMNSLVERSVQILEEEKEWITIMYVVRAWGFQMMLHFSVLLTTIIKENIYAYQEPEP